VAGDAIPEELADLAEALLTDRYVIVHRAMLDHLPQLRLPTRLAPRLLPIVASWAQAYIDDPDVLEDALWALRCLADMLDDQRQVLGWHSHALSLVHRLRPHDREWMLTSSWPLPLRAHPAWSRAALGALASRELADYFNVRNDPLLAALLDQLHSDLGVTIVYVSHEFGAVERFVQRIVLVRRTIVFDGTPAELPGVWHDPSHVHVRD